jgi:hypothetical protein
MIANAQALLRGTFQQRGNGFHFAAPSPQDLTDPRYLQSSDPYEVLACVLANLQQGRFDVATVPMRLLQTMDVPGLWVACTALIGFAAPMRELRRFVEQTIPTTAGARRYYMCEMAMSSGGRWAPDVILGSYSSVTDADLSRFLSYALSWLIEEEPALIWDGPDVVAHEADPFIDDEPDLAGYTSVVRAQFVALSERIGNDRSVVAEGGVLSIADVCRRLLTRLERGEYPDRIEKARMLIEATTGLDCRRMFSSDGRVQPAAGIVLITRFLESGLAETFEPGHRYFFGHKVPE